MVPKFSKNPSSYIGNLLSEMKDKDHSIYLDNNRWKIDEKIDENRFAPANRHLIIKQIQLIKIDKTK